LDADHPAKGVNFARRNTLVAKDILYVTGDAPVTN